MSFFFLPFNACAKFFVFSTLYLEVVASKLSTLFYFLLLLELDILCNERS